MNVVSFDEAQKLVLLHASGLEKLESEATSLLLCCNRVLAEPVAADRDQPPPHRPAPGIDVVVDVLRPQEIVEGVCRRRHGGLPGAGRPVPSTVTSSARGGKAWDAPVSLGGPRAG